MFNLIFVYLFVYMVSCLMFSFFYNHLLMTLMSLEIMMLSMMMMLYIYLLLMGYDYFLLFYLLMIVCEGVLGLSMLILYIRFKGMDKMNLMNLMMW